MNTEIIKVSASDGAEKYEKAVKLLKSDNVVGMPTETVYGLAGNALSELSVKRIFEAKGRPQDNPLIVHISEFSEIYELVSEVPEIAKKLAKKFWPGPLTMILPKSEIVPMCVTAGLNSVAVRCPSHIVARNLIKYSGLPIAAPSANISGKPSPTKAEHVIEDLFGKVDVIIDGGPCNVGVESTIVTLATDPPVLLRPGAVTLETLTSLLGHVQISRTILSEMNDDEIAAAPGMKYKHYAPINPVTLIIGSDKKVITYINKRCETENLAILCYDEDVPYITDCRNIFTIGKANDPMQQARSIFDALRATDECSFITGVIARCPESKDGVNLAVYNRLLKASGFNVIKL